MHVRKCCISSCGKSREIDNVSLHSFPDPNKNRAMFYVWVQAIGGELVELDPDVVYKNRRVCQNHFPLQFKSCSKRLCPDAIPFINIPDEQNDLDQEDENATECGEVNGDLSKNTNLSDKIRMRDELETTALIKEYKGVTTRSAKNVLRNLRRRRKKLK